MTILLIISFSVTNLEAANFSCWQFKSHYKPVVCDLTPAYGVTLSNVTTNNSGTTITLSMSWSHYQGIPFGYHIATLGNDCRPSADRLINYYANGINWEIRIYTDGRMTWMPNPNSYLPPNTIVSIPYLQYNL